MADIVISEIMEEAAIATLSGQYQTHYAAGLVGRLGVGLDNIDLDQCAVRRIAVYPAAGAIFSGLTVESNIRVSAVTAASVLRHLEGAV